MFVQDLQTTGAANKVGVSRTARWMAPNVFETLNSYQVQESISALKLGMSTVVRIAVPNRGRRRDPTWAKKRRDGGADGTTDRYRGRTPIFSWA